MKHADARRISLAILTVASRRSAVSLSAAAQQSCHAFCETDVLSERALDHLCAANPTEPMLAEYLETRMPNIVFDEILLLAAATLRLRRFLCVSGSETQAGLLGIPFGVNREIELILDLPWLAPPRRPPVDDPLLWRGAAGSVNRFLERALQALQSSKPITLPHEPVLIRLRNLAEEGLVPYGADYARWPDVFCDEFCAPGERHIPVQPAREPAPQGRLIVITRYAFCNRGSRDVVLL